MLRIVIPGAVSVACCVREGEGKLHVHVRHVSQ